jgi:aconitase B
MELAGVLNASSDKIYQYMNFNTMEDYIEA